MSDARAVIDSCVDSAKAAIWGDSGIIPAARKACEYLRCNADLTLAVSSLVLAVVSFALSFCQLVAIPLAIVAVILGACIYKMDKLISRSIRMLAALGMVAGIIALVYLLWSVIVNLICMLALLWFIFCGPIVIWWRF